ncbi:MAG: class I SAM-dependent methyltransferase [Cyanobacteriota bacterium]
MSTQIIYVDYEQSEALKREIEVFQQVYGSLSVWESNYLSQCPTPESYFRDYMSRIEGLEFKRQVERLSNYSKVLDIGVGQGETSIYLAAQGYSVSVVEPSPELCKTIELVANSYDFSLNIYNCTAECIDLINDSFDLIIFNSSLHHCDDPVKALYNCYNALKAEGRLLLINEPILQAFRTKKWFYTRLQTHPEEMGHYGGNEHIYRYYEYIKMLKISGFNHIISEPNIYNSDYQTRIQQAEMRTINGKPFYNKRILLLKKIYYYSIEQLKNGGVVGKQILEVLKRISIMQTTFIATK